MTENRVLIVLYAILLALCLYVALSPLISWANERWVDWRRDRMWRRWQDEARAEGGESDA